MSERYGYGEDGEDGDDDDVRQPEDPDYDLSEQHGYAWYPEREQGEWPLPKWALAVISVVVVVGLVLPTIIFILRAT